VLAGAGALVLLPLLWLGGPARLAPCEASSAGPTIESPHEAGLHGAWLRSARDRINARWRPPRAREEGEAGAVVLRFVVQGRGHIRDLETVCASGSKALVKAARRAIKAASPLEPLPAQSPVDSLTLSWRFQYEWRGADEEQEYPARKWVR
jgi:TonB family protein